eukprot:125772-Chlamydomonas_euryale.AAC.1
MHPPVQAAQAAAPPFESQPSTSSPLLPPTPPAPAPHPLQLPCTSPPAQAACGNTSSTLSPQPQIRPLNAYSFTVPPPGTRLERAHRCQQRAQRQHLRQRHRQLQRPR